MVSNIKGGHTLYCATCGNMGDEDVCQTCELHPPTNFRKYGHSDTFIETRVGVHYAPDGTLCWLCSAPATRTLTVKGFVTVPSSPKHQPGLGFTKHSFEKIYTCDRHGTTKRYLTKDEEKIFLEAECHTE